MKSSSAQRPNGRIIHGEKKREQSGGYAAGGETGTKNMKELCCKRKTAVRHADEKNVVETRRADKSRASCEREVAMKSSPSARHNGGSVHAEQKRGQSCGCAGVCMCKCNNLHARECAHNKHDVRARACLHAHRVASRMCTCKKKEQKKDNRARAWAQVLVCVSVRACVNTHTSNARVTTCA